MQEDDLGREIIVTAFTLEGGSCQACPGHVLSIIRDIIEIIGMDTSGLEPAIWFYPLEDGRGGYGFTLTQPITTSFIVWDAWPAHGHAFLNITSCMPYDPAIVEKYLSAHYRVHERVSYRMGYGNGM